jgi:UDP-N-acetylmuramate--alanine ligase
VKIHMIGIGGAGMSGIAEVLASRGHELTGSDLKESPYTRRLRDAGITVHIGHTPDQVGDADQVVISTAIPKTNPELLEARRRSIPIIPRAAALAWILEGNRSLAVAGTHGKTTTTSMTAHVLRALGENPTALVGGELNDIGSNVAFGRSDFVVAEADESDRSLLHLAPQAAVVTNIEFDHPDFYSSLEDVVETFEQFVRSLPEGGVLITCADDSRCLGVAAEAPCPAITYGIDSGDLRAEILGPNRYMLLEDGVRRGEVELGVYGRHNALNSLAAAGVARWLGYDAYEAVLTLRAFGGVRRRLQLKGEVADIRVVDDYAHHPTELAVTLAAVRSTMTNGGRVIAVFQPHRYSRTRALYREFGDSFAAADAVLITEVYGAGEMPQPGVNGKLVVDAICETRGHPEVYYIPQQDAIPRVLGEICETGDLVLTLGAGDISQVGESLLDVLEGSGSQP